MSSLVERLRLRSDRKPVYNLDESDDEDFVPKKDRNFEQVEAIVRTDAVCCHSSYLIKLLSMEFLFVLFFILCCFVFLWMHRKKMHVKLVAKVQIL